MRNCTERYGDINGIGEALSGSRTKSFDEAVWMLAQLMAAGEKHCAREGIPCEKALTVDEILDACDAKDFAGMSGAIMDCIVAGREADVEIEETKNAETTPATTA